jgi:hypothetical protein
MASVSRLWREAAQRDARGRVLWSSMGVLGRFGIIATDFLWALEGCDGAIVGTTAHLALTCGMDASLLQAGGNQCFVEDDSGGIKASQRRMTVIVPKGRREVLQAMLGTWTPNGWVRKRVDWAGGGDLCIHAVSETSIGGENGVRGS